MSSRIQRRRKEIFDIYSRNWKQVFPYTTIKDNPSFQNVEFLCPLCFRGYTNKGLHQKYNDSLTLEHVPPESLDGEGSLLLCKKCNNKTGTIDRKIALERNFSSFIKGELHSYHNGAIRFNDEYFPTIVKHREYGFEFSNLNKYALEKIKEEFRNNRTIKIDFPGNSHLRDSQIAQLKIAYLLAFKKFGYSLILEEPYRYIREQILNPTQIVFPSLSIATPQDSTFREGVFFVKNPVELQSIFVVFKIKLAHKTEFRGMLLPPPGVDAVKFYALAGYMNDERHIEYHILPEENYLEHKTFTLFYQLWDSFLIHFNKKN